ncbi:hypothetical protein ITP53_28640 [Nonomuraea sp. K274]|uniref:Uncharacterized protein n=1 Tax=Nonomuraea cypriaca TaxID=1187855 RepID=A0A931EZA2_9ACTN|nr:hypothetical protein [Nonomuraea cypriaca]MBF8189634.1 hypothetical protein [Nonomuraea cypriaca]
MRGRPFLFSARAGTAPNHLPLGGGALHADGARRLRIKRTAFTSDTDGAVVGTQT